MANPDFDSIVSSSIIKFVVGPEEKVSFMHKDLIARQSRALDVLVNGPMMEAQEACVRWKDVDHETFKRFFLFAYMGDYAGAEPILRAGSSVEEDGEEKDSDEDVSDEDEDSDEEDDSDEDDENEDEDEESLMPGQQPVAHSASLLLLPTYLSGAYERNDSATPTIFLGKRFNGETHACGEAFVSHVKVYLFADCYGIEELKTLSARKLWHLLEAYRVEKAGVEDVVYLVDSVYGNAAGESLPGCGELRRVVNVFVACHADKLWEAEEFRELLRDGGEFAVGLMGEMMVRHGLHA